MANDEEKDTPQVSVSRSLTPKVPANLVQGVPARCLLASCGKAFRTDQSSAPHLRPCSSFDIFVSHDWGTSGWLKYTSLLVLLNSRAAAIATLLVSLICGVLVGCGVFPNDLLIVSIGYFTFVIFFLFWQHIRDMFFTPKLAFLDKLTIPQEDEKLKEQCILGLQGFLNHSRKLVVLFSEEYIGRLWCIYEVTAFLRMRASGDVQTVPVVLPLLLLLHASWWFAVRLYLALLYQTVRQPSVNFGFSIAGGVLIFLIASPLQAWVGLRLTKSLQRLSRQLRSFDIHQTKCSCCSADHVKANGDQIPCDRDLITILSISDSLSGMVIKVTIWLSLKFRASRFSTKLWGLNLLIWFCPLAGLRLCLWTSWFTPFWAWTLHIWSSRLQIQLGEPSRNLLHGLPSSLWRDPWLLTTTTCHRVLSTFGPARLSGLSLSSSIDGPSWSEWFLPSLSFLHGSLPLHWSFCQPCWLLTTVGGLLLLLLFWWRLWAFGC